MGKGTFWNGKYYVIPQAASKIDSSGLNRVQLGASGRIAIIGEMTGLVAPKTIKVVGSPSLALSLIHPDAEEARLATQLVFDPVPGSEMPGASEIRLIPVNPSTQAANTFDSVLTLTSFLYGLSANQVKAKIEAGTSLGKKVSIAYQDETEVFDNVEKPSFELQYTGAGSAAVMTIDISAATHLLTTTCTGASGDDLSLDLNVYTTIQALTDAIAATGKYTLTVKTDRPKNDLSMELDTVTAQDIKTAAYTAKAELQAIVDALNGSGGATTQSGYVSATRVADAGAAPANIDWTYLAGGIDGVTANSDWQEAFDLLKTVDMDIIVALSADASIHAMGDSHCSYMSGPDGKSERDFFCGGALQAWGNESARSTALAALKAAYKALNSDCTVHASLGSDHYDPEGDIKLYPAYITACMYAGMAAGSKPTMPLTRKYLRCSGLEVDLRTEELTELLEAGGAPPIPDTVRGAGYVISRQITTWLQSDDLYRIEYSVRRGSNYIARQVRNEHELLIGGESTESLDETIINKTNAVLNKAKLDDLIRSYDPTKTQLRAEGTDRFIDYEAEPILPINNIFSTYHLKPTVFTIQL